MKFLVFIIFSIQIVCASSNINKCGNKHKCSEMKSCKEAYFYLKNCGITKLDRDKDGIPCENLCKGLKN